jgi:hypothetical protein
MQSGYHLAHGYALPSAAFAERNSGRSRYSERLMLVRSHGNYHARQAFSATIGWPALQANAF